ETPYSIEIDISWKKQELPGNLPILMIPSISIEFVKNEKGTKYILLNTNIHGDRYIVEREYFTDNTDDIDEIQNKILISLISKIKDLQIPQAHDVLFDSTEIEEDDDLPDPRPIDPIATDPIPTDPSIEPHPSVPKTSGIHQFEKAQEYELKLSAGVQLNTFISDDGVGEGSSEPTGISITAEIGMFDISDIIAPKILFLGNLLAATDEIWMLKSAQLSGSILTVGAFAEIDFQEFLSSVEGRGLLGQRETDIYAFAGAGIIGDIISLRRSQIEIASIPQESEALDAFMFGIAWYAKGRIRGILTEELFAEIFFINSLQFADKISGGFILTFSLGYNIDETMTIICDFTFGYWEYALPDDQKLFQDYTGIKFGLSIKY
ncbi:MAG: hypothetical protein K8S87_09455, partial [Planctomycetes bacterium]|nr:hypothetical protein [Planctomycetota bacterium]